MKQIVALFILLVAIMFAAAWLSKNDNSAKLFRIVTNNLATESPDPALEPKKSIVVGSNVFEIEIADTQEKRQKGLSGRESLEKNTGMLFIFEKQNTRPPFWMKGMLVPIDIVWIDNDKVVQLNTEVPQETGKEEKQLRQYMANQPIDYVLELPAGTVKETKIRVGDRVELPAL